MYLKTSFHLVLLCMASLLLALAGCKTNTVTSTSAKSYTVGILTHAQSFAATLDGFKADLTRLGYEEGADITYLYDGPKTGAELEAALNKLLAQEPDLIFTMGTPATTAVKQNAAAQHIPVVFAPVNDPVGSGIVDSLEQPGGNFTGIRPGTTDAKALEWLLRLAPDVTTVVVPHVPTDSSSVQSLAAVTAGAEQLGLQLIVVEVQTVEDIQALELPSEAEAIVLLRSGLILSNAGILTQAAGLRGIPTVSTDIVESEVLVAYGSEYYEMGKQAGHLADQIFQGIPSADLPVESGESFLYINLETASQINLTIADSLLRQADFIVRGTGS